MPSRFIQSIVASRSSSTDRSMPLRAESAWRRNWITETPAISCGYWKPRNMPALARTSVGHSVTSSPWSRMRPAVTSYSGDPSRVLASVRLAGAVGAHDRVHLAGGDDEVEPTKDLRRGRRSVGGPHVQALHLEERRNRGLGHTHESRETG